MEAWNELMTLLDGPTLQPIFGVTIELQVNGIVLNLSRPHQFPYATRQALSLRETVTLTTLDDNCLIEYLRDKGIQSNFQLVQVSAIGAVVNICSICSLFPSGKPLYCADMVRLHSNQANCDYFVCSSCLLVYVGALNTAVKALGDFCSVKHDINNLASDNDETLIHLPDPMSLACFVPRGSRLDYALDQKEMEKRQRLKLTRLDNYWISVINVIVFHNQFSSEPCSDILRRKEKLSTFAGVDYISTEILLGCAIFSELIAIMMSNVRTVPCQLKDVMMCADSPIEVMISLPCDTTHDIYHNFHPDCLGTSIKDMASRGPVVCPSCKHNNQPIGQEILKRLCDEGYIDRATYDRAIDFNALHGELIILRCPSCNIPAGFENVPATWTCVCGQECCCGCQMKAHRGMTCQESKTENARMIEAEIEGSLQFPRRCPGCRTLHDSPLDCQHVVCTEASCRMSFCFLCGVIRSPTLDHGMHYHAPNCEFFKKCCDRNCTATQSNCVSDVFKADCSECKRVGRLCTRPGAAEVSYRVEDVNNASSSGEQSDKTEVKIDVIKPTILPPPPDKHGHASHVASALTPFDAVSECEYCASQFDMFIHKFHCSGCGRVVCTGCSSDILLVHIDASQKVRVCFICCEQVETSQLTDLYPNDDDDG